jgi:hypothetical protein
MSKGLKTKSGLIFMLIALFAGCVFIFADRGLAAEDQPPAPSVQNMAQGPAGTTPMDCQQLMEQIQQQRNLISREAGQLKREIAALREDVGKPGIKEVFAGIGYIFGLAGIGIYVSNRRRAQTRTPSAVRN